MVEHATYPEHIGALLVDADLEAGSVYATLAERGVEVANGHHRISAIAAATTDAERLRVRTGTPLLRQERTVFASDGLPIEHSDDRWRSDAIVLDAVNSVQGSQLARRVATE
jgi:GntR family transcriptional regulator